MRRVSLVALALVSALAPSSALAHGFGQRIDLPVPLYLYLFGGGAVVALSFILLGLVSGRFTEWLHHSPTLELTRYGWCRTLTSRASLAPIKLLFVLVLVVAVASGIWGDQNPAFNVLPTVVWTLFAIGVTFVSAFIGNIWSIINPFKTMYEYAEAKLRRIGLSWNAEPPSAALGVWPAFLLFFVFRWVENVSLISSEPRMLALFVLSYAAITLTGMASFGKDEWLRHGDPFAVFFSFLSRFSITESKTESGETKVFLRFPGAGLLQHGATLSETAFILLMLSSVAADGMLTTPFFQNLFTLLLDVGLSWYLVGTLGLAGLLAAFVTLYWCFSFLTKTVSGDTSSTLEVARRFICSLLPIAIAYEVAHYVSILVIEGQRVLYLFSDPFGKGWNLFGTAGYKISYTVLNLKVLWNIQVALIVVGHVIAVIIAHAIAERFFKNSRKALISQYPMLALMIFYSCLSLWIIAQPIVAVE